MSKKISFPRKSLNISFATNVIVTLLVFMMILLSYNFTKDFFDKNLRKSALTDKIIYYDEVLTMSTHQFALTGDKKWQIRYNKYEKLLDDVLAEILNLSSDEQEKQQIHQTFYANEILVELEKRVFDGYKKHGIRVYDILNSGEYIENKNMYSMSITNFVMREKEILNKRIEFLQYILVATILFITLFLLLMIFLWRSCYASISSWVEQSKKFSEKISESKKKLLASNKKLQKFAYICSHDLKEPIRNISNLIKLIENSSAKNKKNKQYFDYIYEATEKLYSLVDKLFYYAKANDRSNKKKYFDLNNLIVSVVKSYKTANKDVEFIVKKKYPQIYGYNFQIEQLFNNLINNAIKFRQKNKKLKIFISHYEAGKFHKFVVTDNGVGISKDESEKVFSLFYGSGGHSSSGVGLAICYDVVDNHDGKISLKSEGYNKGSSFTFTLAKK